MTKIKRVLVTGASRGIGKAIALRLASSGFAISVHYNSRKDAAEEVVAEIEKSGGQAHSLQFDIANREQCLTVLNSEQENNGAWYGAVCNAGIAIDKAFPSITGEDWDQVIHTNLDGMYNVLNPIIMPMIKLRQGGRIVTLSSVSGLIGNRGQVNYSAAKAGIIGASKALAIELAKRNITVNCIAPGVIETDMTEDIFHEEAMKMIPMKRYGKPGEVAGTVNFLFSEEAAYITRQVISVNGGMC